MNQDLIKKIEAEITECRAVLDTFQKGTLEREFWLGRWSGINEIYAMLLKEQRNHPTKR